MGVEFEAQMQEEVTHVRTRELQQESVEKLDNIIPVINTIDEVNLSSMESNIEETKQILVTNIDNQVNLDDIMTGINSIKRTLSKLNKSVKTLQNTVDEIQKSLGDNNG